MVVLVRGIGDIGSAVAHCLLRAGYGVVIHDSSKPTTTRRGMAFADAAFDGRAVLDGVEAVLADDLDHIQETLARRDVIPVHVRPLGPLLSMSVTGRWWTLGCASTRRRRSRSVMRT